VNKKIALRVVRGIGANGFGQMVTVAIQVMSLPVFLHVWGKDLYGEWLVLSSLPIYISMSDVGLTTVAANEMTMSVARSDRATALEIFQSAWLMVSLTSSFLATLMILLSLLPIRNWLNITDLNQFEVIGIVLFMAIYAMVGMQLNLLVAGFQCDGNYSLGVILVGLLRLSEFVIVTLAVSLGGSPVAAALLFLGSRLVGVFLIRLRLLEKSKWLTHGYANAKLLVIKKLIRPALASMSFPLGMAINNQGIMMAIAVILTPGDVVIFSTLRTLCRLALQVMGMIKGAVAPEISAAYATRDMALATSCLPRISVACIAAAGILGCDGG
jgi:O-antigen/teichoic acid export membrane protein